MQVNTGSGEESGDILPYAGGESDESQDPWKVVQCYTTEHNTLAFFLFHDFSASRQSICKILDITTAAVYMQVKRKLIGWVLCLGHESGQLCFIYG